MNISVSYLAGHNFEAKAHDVENGTKARAALSYL